MSDHTTFSVLDLAPVKQGGSVGETFKDSLDLAKHVERWGYTRFWLAEHHNISGIASAATAVLIGYIAGGTSTIRVGSGGVMLPNHSPLVIAEQFGTLALRRDLNSHGEDFPKQVQELLRYLGPAIPGQVVRAIPGIGTNVPIWLLGSSTFSAQLAAHLGLRFAFAGQFAPQQMQEALTLYRKNFRPSQWLDKPYSMAGIPLIAADSDREAHRLATTLYLKFLHLIRGEPILATPPVDSMEGLWTPYERSVVEMKLAAAIIGAPDTVKRKLEEFVETMNVDEVMINTDAFHHGDRLHSYELVAELMQASVV
jgi:alkanesulfonate monooxygenase SsuD/methylene tetrahydromethanopterin reductase-like flavin-dependent oxidoreductase (luciferase family)